MIWQPRVPRMFAGDRTRIDHRAEYEWQTRSRLAHESAPVLTRALSPTLHGNDPFSKQLPGSDFSLLGLFCVLGGFPTTFSLTVSYRFCSRQGIRSDLAKFYVGQISARMCNFRRMKRVE